MTKSKVLKTNITALGFATQTVGMLVEIFLRSLPEDKRNEVEADQPKHTNTEISYSTHSKMSRKWTANLASTLSVQDILQAIDAKFSTPSKRCGLFKDCGCKNHTYRVLSNKLVGLGMTRFDWIHLPQSTVEGVKIAKKQWLGQPIGLLGTLSSQAIFHLQNLDDRGSWYLDKEGETPVQTVKDLLDLKLDITNRYDKVGNCLRTLRNTQQRLREVGFNRNDGLFMQTNFTTSTKDEVIKDVMSRANLSHREAEMFVETAAKVGRYDRLWDWE